MLNTVVLICVSFATSVLSIFIILILTRHFGIYDRIDERKIHTGNIPRLGGIGIFLGFVLGLILFWVLSGKHNFLGNRIWHLIIGCALIFTMGVWDDLKPWRARYKLAVQIVAAVLVLSAGFVFRRLTFGPLGIVWAMGWFGYVLTFFWIIGVTNAVNLIDGIDGLAASIAAMAALTYAVFFFQYESIGAVLVCILLTVSIGGFLVFNLPLPHAKIFMGDGGSQFLGFALAVLPLMPMKDGQVAIALPYAFAVLIIPIFDTFAAIWRRVREKRSIDMPDKFHLHHKLMMMGFTTPHTLLILVCFQLSISLLVAVSAWLHGFLAFVLLFSVYLFAILFFTVVHIRKEEIQEKSKLL